MSEHTNRPDYEQGAQRSVGEARGNVPFGRGPGATRQEVFRHGRGRLVRGGKLAVRRLAESPPSFRVMEPGVDASTGSAAGKARTPALQNLASVRAEYGVVLIAAPGWIGRLISRGPSTPAYRRIIVILGAREVVQGLICWPRPTPTLLRVGATVDFIHAASMLSIAAASKRWRGPAVASGLAALTFAVLGLHDARTQPSHDVTPSDPPPRPSLHFLEPLLQTRDHVADELAQSASRARDHFLKHPPEARTSGRWT